MIAIQDSGSNVAHAYSIFGSIGETLPVGMHRLLEKQGTETFLGLCSPSMVNMSLR